MGSARAIAARTGVFGELSMDWLAVSMGHDLICYPSSRGGCMTPYPELSGPAATVGVVTGRTDRRFEARLGLRLANLPCP